MGISSFYGCCTKQYLRFRRPIGFVQIILSEENVIVNGFLFIGKNTCQALSVHHFNAILSCLVPGQVTVTLQAGNKGEAA